MPMPSKRAVRRIPARPREEVVDEAAEEERPRASRSNGESPGESLIRGGWTEGDKQMAKGSGFAASLKLEEKAQFIKFLQDTPYADFRRHWIERNTKDGKQLRAWTCLDSVDKECPLCDIGDRAQSVAAFNVAIIGDDGQVLVKSWDVGPRLYQVLKGYANDPKIGPLTKGYFVVSKTGKRGTVQHNVSPVSKTALEEDYGLVAPTKAELDALKCYDASIISIPAAKDLRELAEEIADDYE
jgi:hypothetical protein